MKEQPVLVQPVQPMPVPQPMYREVVREPQYVVRDPREATYIEAGPGRPVSVSYRLTLNCHANAGL